MPSWITPIIAGADVQDAALYNMLAAAMNERAAVLDRAPVQPGSALTAQVAPTLLLGDELAGPLEWFSLVTHAYPSQPGDINGLHVQLINLFGVFGQNWVDYRVALSPTPTPLDVRAGRTSLLGLPQTYSYQWDGTTQSEIVAGRNGMLRRQRRREITAANAATDMQGNPATAGHRAYHINDAGRRIWKCSSPGSWAVDGNDQSPPDLLDNTLLPPNTIAQVNTNFAGYFVGVDDGTSKLGGRSVQGDHITGINFEEIRLYADAMRWTARTGTYLQGIVPAPSVSYSVTRTGASAAAAEAAAIAAWPPAPGAAVFGSGPNFSTFVSLSGATYTSGISKIGGSGWATSRFNTLVSPSVWSVVTATAPSAAPDGVFDSQDDTVVLGTNLYYGGIQTGLVIIAPDPGNATPAPNFNPAAPISGGPSETMGWVMPNVIQMCLRWNCGAVNGGLQYCTATDV